MNTNINPGILKKLLPLTKLNTIGNPSFYLTSASVPIPAAESQGRTTKISYTLVFTMLMAISANAFVYLPFTPVPITMQVLTVLLSAIALGSRLALLSQLQYVLAGLLGAPVFAGFKSGLATIIGPTGGYIIGFLAAAFITGYIFENNLFAAITKLFRVTVSKSFLERNSSRAVSMFVSCTAGLLVIYTFGFIHLYGFIYITAKTAGLLDIFGKTIKLGVIPFAIIDFLKILVIINLDKVFRIKA
jgi:biotin transport system substrate-specific component